MEIQGLGLGSGTRPRHSPACSPAAGRRLASSGLWVYIQGLGFGERQSRTTSEQPTLVADQASLACTHGNSGKPPTMQPHYEGRRMHAVSSRGRRTKVSRVQARQRQAKAQAAHAPGPASSHRRRHHLHKALQRELLCRGTHVFKANMLLHQLQKQPHEQGARTTNNGMHIKFQTVSI